MPHTKCFIDEKEYRLDFYKQSIPDGEMVYGTVFTTPVIEFEYRIIYSDKQMASPKPIDLEAKKWVAIHEAISNYNDDDSVWID